MNTLRFYGTLIKYPFMKNIFKESFVSKVKPEKITRLEICELDHKVLLKYPVKVVLKTTLYESILNETISFILTNNRVLYDIVEKKQIYMNDEIGNMQSYPNDHQKNTILKSIKQKIERITDIKYIVLETKQIKNDITVFGNSYYRYDVTIYKANSILKQLSSIQ